MIEELQISIGIASYNQQEYLCDAIDSALSQTIPCEIVVCNDGSTDNSLEIAKSYPVKVIDQVNKGLASARNTIIMNATGRYIVFLDSDDILLDNCVEKMIEVIKQTDADIISPSFRTFGTSNETIILMDNPKLEDFKLGNRLPYFCAVKREALLEVGGYSPRMTWGAEDLHLWINLLTRGKTVATIKEPLVLYRTKENSMWTETRNHEKEFLAQIEKDFPLW